MDDIVWSYRNDDWIRQSDLVGYDVESRDGSIGKIDEASTEADRRWLVVDTGFWILGKKRVIPAGTVTGVDHDARTVAVHMSKAAIKAAPDYDDAEWASEQTRARHTEHYRPFTGQDRD